MRIAKKRQIYLIAKSVIFPGIILYFANVLPLEKDLLTREQLTGSEH